jgi:hypothetical protein
MHAEGASRRLIPGRTVVALTEGEIGMDHYSMELIGRQQVAEWRRDADASRLVRESRDRSRTPRLLLPVWRIVHRLVPAT